MRSITTWHLVSLDIFQDATMEEVEAAAKAANASDFILTLPQAGIVQKLDHCFDSFFEIQKTFQGAVKEEAIMVYTFICILFCMAHMVV